MSVSPVRPKWRPALWMIVFGVLMAVALLPVLVLFAVLGLEQVLDSQFRLRSLAGFMTLALGSMALAGLIGAVFLRTLLRPLQELIARTGEIEDGARDAFRPVETGGTQEVATLGTRFFRLAQRLSDRSNYLTLFATHVSHELKTPLTAIQGATELLRDDGNMDDAQRTRFLNNIHRDASRLAELSTRLRELARADMADTAGTSDLYAVLKSAASGAGLELEYEGSQAVVLAMSEDNARIVWHQIVENAAQHQATKLKVQVTCDNGLARVDIGDDGVALSVADRDRLFEPFFTTRRESGGTGLGLGIARSMLVSHGGQIDVSDRAGFKFQARLALG